MTTTPYVHPQDELDARREAADDMVNERNAAALRDFVHDTRAMTRESQELVQNLQAQVLELRQALEMLSGSVGQLRAKVQGSGPT